MAGLNINWRIAATILELGNDVGFLEGFFVDEELAVPDFDIISGSEYLPGMTCSVSPGRRTETALANDLNGAVLDPGFVSLPVVLT